VCPHRRLLSVLVTAVLAVFAFGGVATGQAPAPFYPLPTPDPSCPTAENTI
jgi:hypothetical protein